MFSKPTFGQTTTPSFGGFAAPGTQAQAGTSTPFGQNTFNKPQTLGNTGFPAPSFGTGSTMFGGATQTTSTGLFGSTAAPAFGQPAQQAPTGFSGFNTAASTPLFGASTGVSSFAQPKPTFGGFGANTASSGLFGSQPAGTNVSQPGSSLFNQTPSLFSSGFGAPGTSGTATVGTPIKFNAPTGTDSMAKNGLTQTINTRHQCITCMKEYENKSLEELRLEDLQSGRRGPTGGDGGLFGSTAQGQQPSLFGSSGMAQPGAGGTGFGENKSLFGAPATTSTGLGGFGTANTFGAQSTSLFGKPTGFGVTTTTSASGFSFNNNVTNTNPFGAANQNKPFGATTGSLFGSQPATGNVFGAQPNASFGGGTFGAQPQQQQQQQQGIGLFGQNKTNTPFGMTNQPATSTAFSFGQNTVNNTQGGGLFGAKPQLGGLGTSFGTTSVFGAKPAGATPAPAFGSAPFGSTANTSLGGPSTGLFGQSTFSKPGTTAQPFGFGQPQAATMPGQGLGSGGLFGSTLGKPAGTGGLFGTSGGGLFGAPTSTTSTGFGLGTGSTFGQGLSGGLGLGQPTSLNFNTKPMFPGLGGAPAMGQAAPSASQDAHQKMLALVANPYDRPLFRNLPTDKLDEMMARPTNAAAQKAVLSHSPSYALSSAKPRLPVSPKTSLTPAKKSLFDGLESPKGSPANLMTSASPSTPTFEHRRLILRNRRTPSSAGPSIIASPVVSSPAAAEVPEPRPVTRPAGPGWMAKETPGPASAATAEGDRESTPIPREKEAPVNDSMAELRPQRRLALDEVHSPRSDSNVSVASEFNESLGMGGEGPQMTHPAGIKLRRHGYFTIPSLDTLATRVDENGRCEVADFTIARTNYGNIYFEGPLDVAGLNLDELVHIRHREVVVYPDDDRKPPFGQGLNRKAQVTLDNVYPPNKQTREPITDPEALTEMGYENTLRRSCQKMKASFVEYRPDTGSFVFKVPHFSKYEVSEDAEDAEELLKQQQQQQAATALKKTRTEPKQPAEPAQQGVPIPPLPAALQAPLASSSVLFPANMSPPAQDSELMDEGGIPDARSPTEQLFHHAGTNAYKMRLMKASLFMETEDSHQESPSAAMEDPHPGLLASMLETPPPSVGRPAPYEAAEAEEVQEPRRCRPKQRPALVTPRFQLLSTAAPKNQHTSSADAALFLSGNCKPSWGPKSILVVPDGNSVDLVTPYQHIRGFKEWVEVHLSVQLRHSLVDEEATAAGVVPRRGPRPGLGALEAHCHTLTGRPDLSSRERLIEQVLRLCLALWGSLSTIPYEAPPALVSQLRREAVVDWLQDTLDMEEQLKGPTNTPPGIQGAVQHLLRGRVLDGVSTCQERGEHYSALVLATAGSGSVCRHLVQRQLTEWVSDEVSTLINPILLRAWLLAGAALPLLPLENGDTLNGLQDLDWVSCLAVHFWYLCSPGASIPDVLSKYEQAFTDKKHRYAAPPIPAGGTEEAFDIRYHLLKLFSQRSHALEPLLRVETHFPDSQLDSSLGWLVLLLLESLRYTHVEEHCAQSLHLAFSEQLEAAGLWHWAVFVMQHIPDQAMRQSAVEQVVERHVTLHQSGWAMPNELSPQEEFVVSQLGVPATMVFRAKAALAACRQMHPEVACYQLHAEDWAGCHRTLVDHLAADAIINENPLLILRLLRALKPHSREIENWEGQGAVFLSYLSLQEELRGLQKAGLGLGTPSNMEALHQRVFSLINKISSLPSATPKDRLCQSEIAQRSVVMGQKLLASAGASSPGRRYSELVGGVPVPDDYRLHELQQAASYIMRDA